MQYMGQTGVNSLTYTTERLPDCFVCAMNFADFKMNNIKVMKLQQVYDKIKVDNDLLKPTLNTMEGDIIYISGPESLEQLHRKKLDMTIDQLISDGTLTTTDDKKSLFVMTFDKNIKSKLVLKLHLEQEAMVD